MSAEIPVSMLMSVMHPIAYNEHVITVYNDSRTMTFVIVPPLHCSGFVKSKCM